MAVYRGSEFVNILCRNATCVGGRCQQVSTAGSWESAAGNIFWVWCCCMSLAYSWSVHSCYTSSVL